MKKKRAGVVSSLKMIHGNSLEAVENRICSARTALIEATADLQELSSVCYLPCSLLEFGEPILYFTDKGSFSYYVIKEGEGGFQMITFDYEGGGGFWPMIT